MPFFVSGRTLRRVSFLRALAAISLALSAAATTGCPRRIDLMDGGDGDAEGPDTVPLTVDTDGDGLCDGTENVLALDPLLPDTDADGYPDALEYATSSDGRMIDSPARESVVFLSGRRAAVIDTSVTFPVRGSGETMIGAFAPLPTFLQLDEIDAFDYFAGARAVGANPVDNVITFEGERFIGVRNRTLLLYTITFLNDVEEVDCMRLLPFIYQVQATDDGAIFGQRRMWLVVAPPGMTPGDGTWCPVIMAGACR